MFRLQIIALVHYEQGLNYNSEEKESNQILDILQLYALLIRIISGCGHVTIIEIVPGASHEFMSLVLRHGREE